MMERWGMGMLIARTHTRYTTIKRLLEVEGLKIL
jgi:hypothetical protein